MKIKFCGAAYGVTGSCHLLTTENHKVLLDCGQFQGGKAQERMNAEPFPFDAKEVECVVLSHAHIDHCGRLPLLVKRGFSGKIYCTQATADLLDIMLKDAAYIQEKETEWQNTKNRRAGRPEAKPLYTVKDAEQALLLVEPVLYDQLVNINDEMHVVFNDAGHILGSAITELWAKEGDGFAKIVFSGDIGVQNRPILRNPTIIKKADYVIMETTYGNRVHPENAMDVKRLLDIIKVTAKRGGTVVIPSFAVGRTQELIYELSRAYKENSEYSEALKGVNVYIDSPMANNSTKVFKNNSQDFDEETKAYLLKGDDPLSFPQLKFTQTTADSMALNEDKSPKVIISASGMCDAGRIRHHLKHHLWDPKSSVVFVGYQAEGSLGRRIVGGADEVTIFGEPVQVKAEIYNLEGFSGHADKNGLLSWLSGFQQKPKQIFLVHGEEDSKAAFAKLVKEQLGYDTTVIAQPSEYELESARELSTVEFRENIIDTERLGDVRRKISQLHSQLDTVLYNSSLRMNDELTLEQMTEINNIIQRLDKDTFDLGSALANETDPNAPMNNDEER